MLSKIENRKSFVFIYFILKTTTLKLISRKCCFFFLEKQPSSGSVKEWDSNLGIKKRYRGKDNIKNIILFYCLFVYLFAHKKYQYHQMHEF